MQGQESYHSAQSLQASVPLTLGKESRKKIKWPPANNKGAWQDFDNDICEIIQSATKGDVERRLSFMTTIITSLASERFGFVETRQPRRPYTANRRVNKMKDLRKEIRSLKKLYRRASIEERQPLKELRGILRGELKTLRRAEWHRRRRKERSKKRANFLSNPFGFARTLLGEKRNGNLEASEEEINNHLRDTMSDPAKDQNMGINNRLIHQKPPVVQYDTRLPTWKEMQEVVRATRSASAPGPSGVPYIVHKRCKGVLEILWKILRVIWRRGKIVEQWRFAEGVWIPKEEGSKLLDQFRLISLLNSESKIFFSLLSRRLSDFFLGNGYIDTSVQKGGVAGMPGCLEHTGVLTQLLREAKENKGDLTVLWLDLANAYGSIPHKLVEEALTRHHVPPSVCDLIADYYRNFRLRTCSSSVTSEWQTLEKGIITGCTMSAVLFSLTMNMLVKAAEVECRGPLSRSGVRQSPIRAYMDDLTVTTTSVMGGRWLLKGLERNMTWARMYFKPAKSRSLVLKKGKVMEKVRFTVTVESLERAISNRLRRWLGLPRCLSGAALYGNSNALHLPCSSLVEEFKITKTRELLQYTESEDPKVAAAGIQIRSGKELSARRELQVAEERLRHKDILGSIAKGRAGLRFFPSTHTISTKGKERRHLILEEVREGVEEGRYGKMVGLSQQGAWTRREDVQKKRVTWSDCWRPDFNEIRFLIKSVYDVLPSPTNLHIWGKIETPIVNYVLGKDLYNISLVVAQKLWVMVGTVGVTIKYSR